MTQIILSLAKIFSVPGTLLLAICTHESHLQNVLTYNDHGTNSYGICQVKEGTAKLLGFKGDPNKLMDPRTNVIYAAKYLRKQLDRYNGDWCMATAAYNAGSYNPSKVALGKPRNLKYVKSVTMLLDNEHRDMLTCKSREVASE